jgi:hypothetical protein
MPPEWIGVLFAILLDSSLRISVVAAIVAMMLPMSRIRSSDCRHMAWSAVLCAMLLMPVLPYWVPSIAVPLPVRIRSVEVIPATSQTLLPFPGVQSRTALHAPIGPVPSQAFAAEPETTRGRGACLGRDRLRPFLPRPAARGSHRGRDGFLLLLASVRLPSS